jgi:four helix bundle protein
LTVRFSFGKLSIEGGKGHTLNIGSEQFLDPVAQSERGNIMAESIEQLRIYKTARALEDQIYELVKQFPAEQFYGVSNDLRRTSAAVCHHIMGAHRLYSYRLKLDELAAMRREAEATQKHLEDSRAYGSTDQLISEYTAVIKQSWGLTKWIKSKLEAKQEHAEVAAKEQMAEAASS